MAIKAARAYTGRDRIAKFEGAYHGYYDDVQVSYSSRPDDWGPDDAPASTPSSGGVPKHRVLETLVLPVERPRRVRAADHAPRRPSWRRCSSIPCRTAWGSSRPRQGFLAFLRQLTRQHGILLVFDEVISFRVGYHGAQGRYGGEPDLTAFGKIIGGGFPVGATGGRAEVMEVFDPGTRGPRIASGGTFSANPVSMTGGLATMRAMTPAAFDRLEALGARLRARLGDVFRGGRRARRRRPARAPSSGCSSPTGRSAATATSTSRPRRRMERLFYALLDAGVPRPHERAGLPVDADGRPRGRGDRGGRRAGAPDRRPRLTAGRQPPPGEARCCGPPRPCAAWRDPAPSS